jgi:hypothetical protein
MQISISMSVCDLIAIAGNAPVAVLFHGNVETIRQTTPLYDIIAHLSQKANITASQTMVKSVLQLIGSGNIILDTESIRFRKPSNVTKNLSEILGEDHCSDKLRRLAQITNVLRGICKKKNTLASRKQMKNILLFLLNPTERDRKRGSFFDALNLLGVNSSEEEKEVLRDICVFHQEWKDDEYWMQVVDANLTFQRSKRRTPMTHTVMYMDGEPISKKSCF